MMRDNKFYAFITNLRWGDVPTSVQERARLWLLDLLGVAASGTTTRLHEIISEHAREHFAAGKQSVRTLFGGDRVSPVGAALVGGMTIDSIDAHDGHKITKGHVGCGVLPALLANGDLNPDMDASEFLTQLVIGYEIGTRAGIAMHKTALDYHTSGSWISLAAATIVSRHLGLCEQKLREAVGIAEFHGARGLMMRCIDYPTMVKDGSGWGAMAGTSAAFLANSGFTGAPTLLIDAPEVADLWADLGHRWLTLEQYYKPYPVCRWAQPTVQAVLNLKEQYGIDASDVKTIEIQTFHNACRLAVKHPKTTEQAQYSTAFPAASALVYGKLGPEQIHENAFANSEVIRLSESITLCENEEFDNHFPARRFADVKLILNDGTELNSGATEANGDPENPPEPAEMRRKFFEYAEPVIGRERAANIEQQVLGLTPGRSIKPLLDVILSAP
ncbi:MmgE/PrpD family protein [Polycladidibacter hongkongensis]|uniref:MmgE/PrpD family protein n=1 Tax=Polycladidibacter hongkongensis TaxID=1647556 RepID=UPI000A3E03AA|nr:MmgE/PrpD family protein [Pseudovibrio hongkongensis]